jgi:hypothetical protein
MARTPDEMKEWADEHLVYEAQMLRHAGERLHQLGGTPSQERNMAIEAFAVHARCLREFLWHRTAPRKDDARAFQFCNSWKPGRGPRINVRINKEIVHMTYSRKSELADKGWDVEKIFKSIAAKLREFSSVARSTHLDEGTRNELVALTEPMRMPLVEPVVATSVFATHTSQQLEAVPGEPGTIRVRSTYL